MKENKTKIITCEKCFNIPKIIFLNKNKVQIQCPKCQLLKTEDIIYFEKYISSNNIKDELPKCSYNINHESKAVKYCFKCTKYLCEQCIENHNISFQNKSHILLEQKLENQYYCNKEGHNEYIYDRYCQKCQNYLCSHCICEHDKDEIYFFDELNNKNKINNVIENINKIKEIIINEEEKLNKVLEELNNKIKILKKMFNDYKKRNLNLISIYELFIDNYKQINSIRNYNLNNNIIINADFDLSNSDFFISNINNPAECLSSKYNKLCAFYMNKNHIKTKNYSEHLITNKFCNMDIVKKCIFVDDNIVCLFKNNNKELYYITQEDSKYKILIANTSNIKNIYPSGKNNFFTINDKNKFEYWNASSETCKVTDYYNIKHENNYYIIFDLNDKKSIFIVKNDDNTIIINYYYKYSHWSLNYEEYLLYYYNRGDTLKYIIENIINLITISDINEEEKEQFKNIIKENELIKNGLFKIDNKLTELLDNKIISLYEEIKKKLEKETYETEYILNPNYYFYKLKKELNNKENKLEEKDIKKINYISKLNELCFNIRKKYIHYFLLLTKTNNIYNMDNKNLLFMGEKYLLIKYILKDKEFVPFINNNFLDNKNDNYNDYEIKYLNNDFIIMNNNKKKIIYLIEENDDILLLKKKYEYYSNIIANDKYLLFDSIKEHNIIQFNIIDLLKKTFIGNNEITELLNSKIEYNYPKMLLFSNNNKIIALYEKNQLGIINLKIQQDNIDEKENNKKQNIKEIKINSQSNLGQKITEYSNIYSESYNPLYLLDDSSYYFCTTSEFNKSKNYFKLDFCCDFFLEEIKIIYHNDYEDCIPKNCNITVYNKKNDIIRQINFINSKKELYKKIEINEITRYILFDFKDNLGGDYIIIKKLKFEGKILNDID